MIKVKVIFGRDAVAHYKHKNRIPSDKWLENNGGVVDELEFASVKEYNSYCRAIDDMDGWYDAIVLEPEIEKETTSSQKIEIQLGVLSDKSQAEKVVKIINGKTYYNFRAFYGVYAGNYPVTVFTEYPGANENEVKDMLLFLLACNL